MDARWGEGARGEFAVGRELEKLYAHGFHVFHDWQNGQGNVDHFAIGPQGIFAVETKATRGEITARAGKLYRDGRVMPGEWYSRAAMARAFSVRALIKEACGTEPFVVPILCFSHAEVCCYEPVSRVEVVSVGSLNRSFVASRRRRYSPSQVEEISAALQMALDRAPAASPALPPRELSFGQRAIEKFFAIPEPAIVGAMTLIVSLLFPGQFAKALLGIAFLYQLLAQYVPGIV